MSMRVIDLDNKPSTSDNINNIGNAELAKKVQAMTIEEKMVVAKNLPVYILLEAIRDEFDRYNELETKLDEMLKRFGK